ncbi:MAG: hypothetical protein ACPGPS_07605, partial [Rubripirellula sp.]
EHIDAALNIRVPAQFSAGISATPNFRILVSKSGLDGPRTPCTDRNPYVLPDFTTLSGRPAISRER